MVDEGHKAKPEGVPEKPPSPYDLMKLYTRSGKRITHTDLVLDLMVEGVTLVTTVHEDRYYGLAAAWVMRIAGSSYLVMVAVAHSSHTHDFIQQAGCFAVSILAEDQVFVARHFGRQTGREVDKFKRQDFYWETHTTGAPVFLDALGYLDCRLVDAYEPPGGDHTLYIGKVVEAGKLREGKPLIYHREDYPYRVEKMPE
jgi:flavin reductase (DIM6/NTAB) family NADH-FMN oxidoreductase RutF